MVYRNENNEGVENMKISKKAIFCIALAVITVIEIVAVNIYIFSVGNRFDYHTSVFSEYRSLPEPEVTYEKNGVVELDDVRWENNELVLGFKAVEQGDTDATVRFYANDPEESRWTFNCHFNVNQLGLITFSSELYHSFNGFVAVIALILALLLQITAVMVWRFFYDFKRGNFSHTMVACGGIGIYTFVLWMFLTYKLLNNVVNYFSSVYPLIVETGQILLIGLTLPMMILSVALAASNIWLIRNEGYRPVNTLGIIFAVVWFIGSLLTMGSTLLFDINYISNYQTFKVFLIYLIDYFECIFISTVACTYLATKYKIPYDRDYIIILGCAIRRDGSLTPLLKGRVDSAVAFEKEQYEKTGKHAVFVPSGGQGDDEVISEGEAMENYLKEIGIPKEQILREDKSVNTFQNMLFSKKIIEERSGDIKNVKTAFSTTNYHVFRGYILAQKNGFEAKGISSKTKPYFYFNAFLREFIGLLVDKKWLHIAFVLLLIADFVINAFAV